MPLFPPYQGSCPGDPLFSGRLIVGRALAAGLLTAGCQNYSLEPTFCDDWCRVLDETACSLRPADCVQRCQQGTIEGNCTSHHEELLSCYDDTDRDNFICVEGQQRVEGPHCRSERDALYECTLPGIGECLSSCRDLQATFDEAIEMGGAQGDFQSVGDCYVFRKSCETVCWNLMMLTGREKPSSVDAAAGADAGGDLPADEWSATLLVNCSIVLP